MTFEQTMHTIESHLEALQDDYNQKVCSLHSEKNELLVENRQLRERNAYLLEAYDRLSDALERERNNA
jgi:hypothetical protein